MKVRFSRAAETDLESIGDYIAADSPRRALSFVKELRTSCLAIATKPKAFPLLANHKGSGIRRRVHGNYLIFYRIHSDAVDILHVCHGAMDYDRLLFPDG
jgi:toxin ParE1/3/4